MKVYNNAYDAIGNTPLLKLTKFFGEDSNVFGKMECFNPMSSIKDRVAFNMLKVAKEQGLIYSDTVILEPTSGNTGIGLASVCAQMGYKLILTMPNNMSKERILLFQALGAEVVLTDCAFGMKGAIQKIEELKSKFPKFFVPNQFENENNAYIHYITTAKEIAESLENKIDVLVSCVGTGGTLTGIAKYFKDNCINAEIVAVEPSSSAVLSGKQAGKHGIQGIGAGFVPKILDTSLISRIITVEDEDAINFMRNFAKKEGILCGISSGAGLVAVSKIFCDSEYKNKNIVVILPDSGERYLSTGIFG